MNPRVGDGLPQYDVQAVIDYLTLNDKTHIRQAAQDLVYSIGKIWFILRKILKWRAYRPHIAIVLTVKQRKTRLQAAEWFLSHDEEVFATQVPNKSIGHPATLTPSLNAKLKIKRRQCAGRDCSNGT